MRTIEAFCAVAKWQDILLIMHDRESMSEKKVMESYQTWFGKGPELSVLRMLDLFNPPADEKTLGALLKSTIIPGLKESLTDWSPKYDAA
jgi:hypothetical protein